MPFLEAFSFLQQINKKYLDLNFKPETKYLLLKYSLLLHDLFLVIDRFLMHCFE